MGSGVKWRGGAPRLGSPQSGGTDGKGFCPVFIYERRKGKVERCAFKEERNYLRRPQGQGKKETTKKENEGGELFLEVREVQSEKHR